MESTRVFVGNLPFTAEWPQVKDFVKSVGDVKHVKMFMDAQGNSKGSCIVEFATPQAAADAIQQLEGQDFQGRPLHVREDRSAVKPNSTMGAFGNNESCKVMVSGLSPTTTVSDIAHAFKKYDLNLVKFIFPKSKGKCAVVSFVDAKNVVEAIASINQTTIAGSTVTVEQDFN